MSLLRLRSVNRSSNKRTCVCVCVCVCVDVWMRQAGVSGPADDVCIIYAELRSGGAGCEQRQVLVCGRQTRHKLVYSSHNADQLQVVIHAAPSASEPIYFMLEFQGLSAAPCRLRGCKNRRANKTRYFNSKRTSRQKQSNGVYTAR